MKNNFISQEAKLYFNYLGACLELRSNQALIAKPFISLAVLHVTILYRYLLTPICINRVLGEDIERHTSQLSAFTEVSIWANTFVKASV